MPKKYFNSDLETGGDMVIAGATTVGTTLDVAGNATVGIKLDVTGATTVGTTLEVTGNTDLSGTLDVTGMTTLIGGLTIDEIVINSTGNITTGGNQISTEGGAILTTTGNITTTSGDFSTTDGDISTGTGDFMTQSGHVKTSKVASPIDLTLTCDSDNTDTTSKIKFCKDSGDTEVASIDQDGTLTAPKVQATGDLTLTCDSDDGSNGDTSSKIKFCKDSGDTEVASIDQAGTFSLGVDAPSNYAKIQSTIVPGNNIELLPNGSSSIFINSSSNVFINPASSGYLRIQGGLIIDDVPGGGLVETDDNVLGIRADSQTGEGTVVQNTSSTFFSQGHIYYSAVQIPAGTAVELVGSSIQPSSTANSNICIGLVAAAEEDLNSGRIDSFGNAHESGWRHKLASLGDSRYKQCNGFKVCNEGGALQPGDLLVTSSTPGYLMKQTDDILRSKTVGKCMQAVTFDDNGQAVDIYGYLYCG